MSISEYFIPFTRMGINLLGERLLIGMQGPPSGKHQGAKEQCRELRGIILT